MRFPVSKTLVLVIAIASLAGPIQSTRSADVETARDTLSRPVIAFSTLVDGGRNEIPSALAMDAAGNVYLAGETFSSDFPTTADAYQGTLNGGTDAFLACLSADGSQMLYATYFGGTGVERITSIAVDDSGSVFVCGYTSSPDLPILGGFQSSIGGGLDAFVARFSGGGRTLDYSSFVGGAGQDVAKALAVDGSGMVYLAGETGSADYPVTAGAFQDMPPRGIDHLSGFVAIVGPSATGMASLSYSTFLGGATRGHDLALTEIGDIAVDGLGRAVVCGMTGDPAFPVTSGAINMIGPQVRGTSDAFVTTLDSRAAGSAGLIYSTYLGGTLNDQCRSVALAANGDVTVGGTTDSRDFPTTAGAPFPVDPGGDDIFSDGFVTTLHFGPDGQSTVAFSTYLGGNSNDVVSDVALDTLGRIVVVGSSSSPDFPLVDPIQAVLSSGCAFVARISTIGDALEYATGFGTGEAAADVCLADGTDPVVLMHSSSRGIPTTPRAFQRVPVQSDVPSQAVVIRISERDADCKVAAEDVTVLASSVTGDIAGASIAFGLPNLSGSLCAEAVVEFAPVSTSFFPAGVSRATAFVISNEAITSIAPFRVRVDVPYDACVSSVDGYQFGIVTAPASPVAGAWALYDRPSNNWYLGVAESIVVVPGKGIVLREATSPDVAFKVRFKPTSGKINLHVKKPGPLPQIRGLSGSCDSLLPY